MTEPKNIAAVGEVLWDEYGEERYVGGAPANFVTHIARTAHHPFLFSRVGDDADGRELVQKLHAENINVTGVQTDIFRPTGRVTIELDRHGVPTFRCSSNVAFDEMRVDSNWESLAPQMDVIFFGMLAQRKDQSREAIHSFLGKAEGALKIFDANIRTWDLANRGTLVDSLKKADILKMNRKECDIIKKGLGGQGDDGDFMHHLLQEYDLKMAALTLGEVGCLIVSPQDREFDPGYYIDAIDSSGAGDAFAAGLVIKYLDAAPLNEIADFANRLAAFVSLCKGAAPPWTVEEIDNVMSLRL